MVRRGAPACPPKAADFATNRECRREAEFADIPTRAHQLSERSVPRVRFYPDSHRKATSFIEPPAEASGATRSEPHKDMSTQIQTSSGLVMTCTAPSWHVTTVRSLASTFSQSAQFGRSRSKTWSPRVKRRVHERNYAPTEQSQSTALMTSPSLLHGWIVRQRTDPRVKARLRYRRNRP